MKNILTRLMTLLFVWLCTIQLHGQEVFFSNPNAVLKTVTPDYYYPMKGDNSALAEYMQPGVSGRDLFLDPTSRTFPATDRWNKANEAMYVSSSSGDSHSGVFVPFTDLIQTNKTLNMCFWAKYSNGVYLGNEGSVLDIIKLFGDAPLVSISIKNKRLTVSKSINGRMRTLGVMDFPIDMDSQAPGAETNGYIFIAISSTWNFDGNRLRLYVGRPGGHLYCRYFYFSPFKDYNVGSIVIGRGYQSIFRAAGMSDLMFFTSGQAANHMMEPEDILNLYYLQSPLYEGVSYSIASTSGYWGLEDRRNTGAALHESDISVEPVTPGSSKSPFGFDKFCFEKDPLNRPKAMIIRSMRQGASLFTATASYPYTSHAGAYYPVVYNRGNNPRSNFDISSSGASFGLLDYNNRDRGLIAYSSGGRQWLSFDYNQNKEIWRIISANRVFRGPERVLTNEEVHLALHGQADATFGKVINHTSNYYNWDYITLISRMTVPRTYPGFIVNLHGRQPYLWTTYRGIPGNYQLSRYSGHTDLTDGNPIITIPTLDCNFELQYAKKDKNGKPLYLLRTANHNVGFLLGTMGAGVPGDPNSRVLQLFENSLNNDGTVPDRCLWSVRRRTGGWPTTLTEQAQLSQDSLKSEQNINKKFFNGLSKTDWPEEPKP